MQIIKPYTSDLALKLDTLLYKADKLKNKKLKPSIRQARQNRLENRDITRANISKCDACYEIGEFKDFYVISPVKNVVDVIKRAFGMTSKSVISRKQISLQAGRNNVNVYVQNPDDISRIIDPVFRDTLNIKESCKYYK